MGGVDPESPRLVPDGPTTQRPHTPFEGLPDVLKTAQAADALQVDPKTIREMIRRGELRAVRCGRLIRIPKSALVEFVEGARLDG
jgi:excisionase family DNA binding protein